MQDSYGDGWNNDYLYIGDTSITLDSGSSSSVTVCLAAGTYSPYACGGIYDSEVSWSIYDENMDFVLDGGADDTCEPSSGNFSTCIKLARPLYTWQDLVSLHFSPPLCLLCYAVISSATLHACVHLDVAS